MKSAVLKGAIALSVLGFTFGSNVVYDSQWQPSIFRTIANAVEFSEITDENVAAEFESLKTMASELKANETLFDTRLNAEEVGLSELIDMRDEAKKLLDESSRIFTRSNDIDTYFTHKEEESELGTEYAKFKDELEFNKTYGFKAILSEKIDTAQETEILEQKAALAATNEKLCENKGLLEDIKAQIAGLLKDKEEVVAEVGDEEEEESEDSGFSANVTTYADFFAHIQEQQRSFFEVSTPSLLGPTNNPMAMFMMMNSVFGSRNAAPRTQVNSYFMTPSFSSFGGTRETGFPGSSFESRDPAAATIPSLMPTFGGNQYTRAISQGSRVNGLLRTFNVN